MSGQISRRSFLKQGTIAVTGLGALWLAACAPPAPAATGGQSGAPAAAAGAPVPALLRSGSGEEDFFKKALDLFKQKHPEVEVSPIFAPGGQDYNTKLD